MKPRSVWVTVLLVFSSTIGLATDGQAQASQARKLEIEGALAERYRLTLIGPGAMGFSGGEGSIRRAGNVVLLRHEGLGGSLNHELPASYGIRGEKAERYRGSESAPLEVGENLYVHSIQVGSDVITLGVLTSRELTTPSGSGHLWAALSFFLSPDIITRGDLTTIYRTLDEWLRPQGAYQPSISEFADTSVEPVELKPGMTREEVVAALGPPRREVIFGAHAWLNYGGLMVVLEEGRLASVDRSSQPPAEVAIVSEPEGAEVYLDGQSVGSTPATLELPAGNYQVVVRLRDYADWNRDLRVLAGSKLTVRARLEK